MKLSLEDLKERAEAIASEELLETISGGTNNACHDSGGRLQSIAEEWGRWLFDTGFGR